MVKLVMPCVLGVLCGLSVSTASFGEVLQEPPRVPDPAAYYLFHMHGSWLEDHAENEANRAYGIYRYGDTLKAFEEQGFVVISEKRSGPVKNRQYVSKLAQQVHALLSAGVPPGHITVSGFSKGGAMTLEAGAALRNPEIKFVVLSGCGIGNFSKGYRQFLERGASKMQGRFLSIYDYRDTDGGTCAAAFDKAGLSDTQEIVLQQGSGHGVFYKPLAEWINPLTAWAKAP
ncbi:MAG: alpha/beta hydrolase [Rhodospirillales bacterium]|nr:alpha/beta hydrolase [Rhodospirillales bacterium]